MHIIESFSQQDNIPVTKVVTLEGEARSGKGTSAAALQENLTAEGRTVEVIDQGQKFRVLTLLGLQQSNADELFDDQTRLGEFIRDDEMQKEMLQLLGQVATWRPDELKARLYAPDINDRVHLTGKNPDAHPVVISLLHDQVAYAAQRNIDTVLVDGRCMAKYGQQIARAKTAQYVTGLYFECDAAISARRSLGVFADIEHMTDKERLELFSETIKLSDRNRQDTLRAVEPMRRPTDATILDLHDWQSADVHEITKSVLKSGMALLDTSYTRSVEEMTVPVTELVSSALRMQDDEHRVFSEHPHLWDIFSPSGTYISAGRGHELRLPVELIAKKVT